MKDSKRWFFADCAARDAARRCGFAAAVVLGTMAVADAATVTEVATNVVGGALAAFNTAAEIGVAILTFLVALGAVMMGWRVARGRGR